ncbi:putative copper transporter 6-like [Sesbania bispinosa]|nr:putative copper transporter 6-like [Sesbania bispinosa]
MEGMTPSSSMNGTMNMDNKSMMRMTLFWGKNTVILFNNWPAGKANMYALALVIVFVISLLIELLSHAGRLIKPGSNRVVVRLVSDSAAPPRRWALLLGHASTHVLQWRSRLGCCAWSCSRLLLL